MNKMYEYDGKIYNMEKFITFTKVDNSKFTDDPKRQYAIVGRTSLNWKTCCCKDFYFPTKEEMEKVWNWLRDRK